MNSTEHSIPHSDPRSFPTRHPIERHWRFVSSPDSFFVDEVPSYLPSGEQGEHLFLHIRKQGLTSQDVVRGLQETLGIHSKSVGVAGQKDKKATTTQWLSLTGVKEESLSDWSMPGVEVLEMKRHGNKLKTGHLRGNLFRLALGEKTPEEVEAFRQDVAFLEEKGVPNAFGPQRFGKQRNNHLRGRELVLSGEKIKTSFHNKMLLSAYQASLFNDLLAMRLRSDTLDTIFAGDRLKKHTTGGEFVCEDPVSDQPRADQLELSPTAWLPGYKVHAAQGLPGQWEQEILQREGLQQESFRAAGKIAKGTRRFLRIPLEQVEIEHSKECLWFSFFLPSGSYASVVLQQLGVRFS